MTAHRHPWRLWGALLGAAFLAASAPCADPAPDAPGASVPSARRRGELRGDHDDDGRWGGGAGGRRQPNLDNLAEMMSAEEFAELRRLQREDPAAFRRQVHERIRQFRQGRAESHQRLRALQQAYREAVDDAARDSARAALAEAVAADFAEQMEANRHRLEQSRARLAEVERKFGERQAQAEEIIADRIRELLEGPPLPESPGHAPRRRPVDGDVSGGPEGDANR